MRQKSWHWDHYFPGEKCNTSHLKAYCNYCTGSELLKIQGVEDAAYKNGSIEAKRSKDVLILEGLSCCFWLEVIGKPDGIPVDVMDPRHSAWQSDLHHRQACNAEQSPSQMPGCAEIAQRLETAIEEDRDDSDVGELVDDPRNTSRQVCPLSQPCLTRLNKSCYRFVSISLISIPSLSQISSTSQTTLDVAKSGRKG
jgi:hypothetical protein